VALSGRVQVLPERTAAAGRRPQLGIDGDLAHQAQVDDKTPVADAVTRDAVTSAADRHGKVRFTREPDRCHHVCNVERSDDQLRVPFDHPVERGSRDVEVPVSRSYDRSSMPLSQLSRR